MQQLATWIFLLCFLPPTLYAQIERGDGILFLDEPVSILAPLPIPSFSAGGGLYRDGGLERTAFHFGGSYGVAVTDPVVIGASLYSNVGFGEYGNRQVDIMPFARFYPLNTAALMAYAEVSSGLSTYRGGSDLFKSARLAVGAHLPVGGGTLVTPNLGYLITEGNNSLYLGAGLQFQLRAPGEEATPVADFSRGTLMLGAESIRLTLFDNGNNVGADVGAHFFVTDGLAVAGLIGYHRRYVNYTFGGSTPDRYLRLSQLHLGLGARYYLVRERQLVWYGEAGAGRMWESLDTNYGIDYLDPSFTYLTAGAGGQYFLSRRFSVEAGPQLRYDLTHKALIAGVNFGVRWIL